jgi:hypothetical protein
MILFNYQMLVKILSIVNIMTKVHLIKCNFNNYYNKQILILLVIVMQILSQVSQIKENHLMVNYIL